MTRAMIFGCLMGLCAAQEEKKETQAVDENRQALVKSLEEFSKVGFKVKGSVKDKSPFGAMMKMSPLAAFEGGYTGSVGADGVIHLDVEVKNGAYELYAQKGKVVQRMTWSGPPVMMGDFPSEVGALLTGIRWLKNLPKDGIVKKADQEVEKTPCHVYQAAFPPALLESKAEGGDNPMANFKMMEVKKIDASFWVGQEDRLPRKIEVKVVKGYSQMVRMQMPGAGDDGEDEKNEGEDDEGGFNMQNMGKMKFTSVYSMTFSEIGKDLAVSIPEEMKKFFKEPAEKDDR